MTTHILAKNTPKKKTCAVKQTPSQKSAAQFFFAYGQKKGAAHKKRGATSRTTPTSTASGEKNRTESVGENTFLKISCLPLTKVNLPSHQVFGAFALEAIKILQATPAKLRKEMRMCAIVIYVQQQ